MTLKFRKWTLYLLFIQKLRLCLVLTNQAAGFFDNKCLQQESMDVFEFVAFVGITHEKDKSDANF